jgi:hypothetical protein
VPPVGGVGGVERPVATVLLWVKLGCERQAMRL